MPSVRDPYGTSSEARRFQENQHFCTAKCSCNERIFLINEAWSEECTAAGQHQHNDSCTRG